MLLPSWLYDRGCAPSIPYPRCSWEEPSLTGFSECTGLSCKFWTSCQRVVVTCANAPFDRNTARAGVIPLPNPGAATNFDRDSSAPGSTGMAATNCNHTDHFVAKSCPNQLRHWTGTPYSCRSNNRCAFGCHFNHRSFAEREWQQLDVARARHVARSRRSAIVVTTISGK